MYVGTFNTGVIVFMCDVIACLTSHWPIMFSIKVSALIVAILVGGSKEANTTLSMQLNKQEFVERLMRMELQWTCIGKPNS